MTLLGAKQNLPGSGIERLPGVASYFKGVHASAWRSNVPNFRRVRFSNIYPHMDLIYYGNQTYLEYDFVLYPGSDARSIRLRFDSAQRIRIEDQGDLVLTTAAGPVLQRKPLAWQVSGDKKVDVPVRYVIRGKEVGLEPGRYDRSRPLIIDPVIVYSTFLGGNNADPGQSVAVDAAGNSYVTGITFSTDFPRASRADSPNAGAGDVFVVKINPAGTALLYSAIIGGSSSDYGLGIAVDATGSAYITGRTASANFPVTAGAARSTYSGGPADGFVAKLNAAGTGLTYSSLVGGSAFDEGSSIALHTDLSAVVLGRTSSGDFPVTPGALQSRARDTNQDLFVLRMNASGTALVSATYFGGTGRDEPGGLAIDASGSTYLTGTTVATDFPTTTGAFQASSAGRQDIFISKLNSTGTGLLYSTYLGGAGVDFGGAIAVRSDNSACVIGVTGSVDFPVRSAIQPAYGGGNSDSLVACIGASGTSLQYSTYLGGIAADTGYSIASDVAGNVYVAGTTGSPDFPVASSPQPALGGGLYDIFLTKLNSAGTAMIYSMLIGGSGEEEGVEMFVDRLGAVYLTGQAMSANFPVTQGAFQTVLGGGFGDAFIAKIEAQATAVAPVFTAGGIVNAASFKAGPISPGEIVTVFGTGFGNSSLNTLRLDSAGRVAASIAGVRLLFDDVPAALVYVTANQLSAIVPYSVSGKSSVSVRIDNLGTHSASANIPVVPSSPGIFTLNASGSGPGAILNQDFSVNSAERPARGGEIITVYATGEGQTNPPGVDGAVVSQLTRPILPVSVTIGGIPAVVSYAGGGPGLVAGVLQVNVAIPNNVPAGALPVRLRVGDMVSPEGVTVAVNP